VIGLPRWPPGGIVLLYHRIADLAHDPQQLAVTPEHFADHLDVINERGVPMTISTLVELAQRGELPRGAVAMTLDDGYSDNLLCAVPLLARARVPATVFISTDAVGTGREFWWDELDRLLLANGTAQPRRYEELCARLRCLDAAARALVLDELWCSAATTRDARATHRPLRRQEIAALSRCEGITIGSHTHSHPSLSCLAPDEQRREIATARLALESIVGGAVTAFAYPFGGAEDVSARTVSIVREEGMAIACSTQPDSVRKGVAPHCVPRVIVRNWSKSEFRERWSSWTH
jgi:peptidoglycan/xylan/chitin deacetylase (PgdA/CDA1 family)